MKEAVCGARKCCAELAVNNPSVTATMAREVEPKLANNFLKSDNPGVVMTSAEVKFLMAEATVKKWNVGSVSAGKYMVYWSMQHGNGPDETFPSVYP